MSRHEVHTGKIKKVDRISYEETFNEMCLRLWRQNSNKESDECYYEGLLFDEYYQKYFKLDGDVWEIFEREEKDADGKEEICKIKENNNGVYDFYVKFWNGRTGIGNVIADELKLKIIQNKWSFSNPEKYEKYLKDTKLKSTLLCNSIIPMRPDIGFYIKVNGNDIAKDVFPEEYEAIIKALDSVFKKLEKIK